MTVFVIRSAGNQVHDDPGLSGVRGYKYTMMYDDPCLS
eukprot:CAMPEP_0172409482 /NCGR_PEP_ID=MMETSP1061-20121228/76390_1 /TAXON_ID=37318 /ORGANISM="Pseudo-nitzschia pungens, Strain cf. pungens" /LENGTH=37 /DNA_ID= /DNA_START= /DNA_END= /DNA_ORIENTATION=